jgi:glutaminyl-peptide cyclotransferase
MRLKWSSDPWSTLCSRLILLPLGLALLSTVVADNHEREFKVLTDPQLQSIVDAQDPTKAFDLKNPSSHLSKILIPRARMSPQTTS